MDRVNNENIAKLKSEAFSYSCMDFFDWRPEHRDDKALEKNTRVMEDGSGCLIALVRIIIQDLICVHSLTLLFRRSIAMKPPPD